MRSLYELCLAEIAANDYRPQGLPQAIEQQVTTYKEHYPYRISFQDRYDCVSILVLCRAIGFPFLKDEEYEIHCNPQRWLNDSSNMADLFKLYLAKLKITEESDLERSRIITLFIHFIYNNSGFLKQSAFKWAPLVKTIEDTLVEVAIAERKWFNDDVIQMISELYSAPINALYKQHVWQDLHTDVRNKQFQTIVNGEFTSFELEGSEPYDIKGSPYWIDLLRKLQTGEKIVTDWRYSEYVSKEDRTNWISNWFYREQIVFSEGHDHRGAWSLDYTSKIATDYLVVTRLF